MIAQEEVKKEKLHQKEEELLRWKAPARLFKKRDREYYTTIGAIVFLLVVILLFIKQWMLIAVIVAFAFVSYVLAAVQPEEVEHVVTSKGIKTGGKTYLWGDLVRFWFEEKWKLKMLVVEVKKGFPARLMMMLSGQDEKELEEALSDYLKMEKPESGIVDKAAGWLSEKVPLESS